MTGIEPKKELVIVGDITKIPFAFCYLFILKNVQSITSSYNKLLKFNQGLLFSLLVVPSR